VRNIHKRIQKLLEARIFAACDATEYEWWYERLREKRWVGNGRIVDLPIAIEVGCFHGGGLAMLAFMMEEFDGYVVGVDGFGTNAFHEDNGDMFDVLRALETLDVRERVVMAVGASERVARLLFPTLAEDKENVVFLHIDADHRYPATLRDFMRFQSRVCVGGIVSFHDITDSQVRKSVDELRAMGRLDDWQKLETPNPYDLEDIEAFSVGWRTEAYVRVK